MIWLKIKLFKFVIILPEFEIKMIVFEFLNCNNIILYVYSHL